MTREGIKREGPVCQKPREARAMLGEDIEGGRAKLT